MNALLQRQIRWLLKEKYHGNASRQFIRDRARIKAGEPVDYVIGYREFLGCRIDLSHRPLIPRAETEYWVEHTAKEIRARNRHVRVLDMFAGSGCIGIALLKHCPQHVIRCDFAEKNASLCEQIALNCTFNAVAKRTYRIIKSDVFSHITGKYDYICANPPYIARTKQRHVQKSVLQYEPHRALFAGNDGLTAIRKFIMHAPTFLGTQGSIIMEFDAWQKPTIAKLVHSAGFSEAVFYRDQFKKWRWVEMRMI